MWSAAQNLASANDAQSFPDIINFASDISDEFLERKFSRPAKASENITYEISDDIALLHQFSIMHGEVYSKANDVQSSKSYTVIAKIGRLCVGGCRISYKENANDLLPMEEDGLSIQSLIADKELSNCAEISCITTLPDYTSAISGLLNKALEHAQKSAAQIAFTISPLSCAREYAKAASSFAMNMQICRDIKMPEKEEFFGENMFISMIDLSGVDLSETLGQKTKREEIAA